MKRVNISTLCTQVMGPSRSTSRAPLALRASGILVAFDKSLCRGCFFFSFSLCLLSVSRAFLPGKKIVTRAVLEQHVLFDTVRDIFSCRSEFSGGELMRLGGGVLWFLI